MSLKYNHHTAKQLTFQRLREIENQTRLHGVHVRLCRPLPATFAKEIEENAKRTPKCGKTHIQHDGRDISIFVDPRSDEFAKPVTPHILIHCDSHEDGASNRFVAVNSISTGERRKCHDLNSGACITDNDDHLK